MSTDWNKSSEIEEILERNFLECKSFKEIKEKWNLALNVDTSLSLAEPSSANFRARSWSAVLIEVKLLALLIMFGWLENVFLKKTLTLLATGYFSPGCHGGGADCAHHFGKPGRASFKIFTSFEKTSLILHGRRPRIQKMKCLAQKLTKWRRIEKLWRKRKIDRFRK